jgi:hypothetical protein
MYQIEPNQIESLAGRRSFAFLCSALKLLVGLAL